MNPQPEALLIIFTKNPELGKVKTRLGKDIGDKAAFKIYNFLLQHTVKVTRELEVEKEVYYSNFIPQQDIWNEGVFTKKLQQGKDLGERMKNAFDEGFQNGFKRIIIIGSDLYDLSSEDLASAFENLKTNEFVLGPAEDGGYYLLGMQHPTPELFQDKKWSTPTVLKDTLIHLTGKQLFLLAERNDIDTYKDIKKHKEFRQFLDK